MISIDYYTQIKTKLIDNEIYERVKEYSKERNRVITYFEIGEILTEAGGKYGDNIIDKYSKKLVVEVGKKYNRRTLFRMKQFYTVFSYEKVSTLSTQLSWSHYTELLPIHDRNKLLYYFNLCREQNIDVRTLRKRIKSNEYERLPLSTRNKLNYNHEPSITDFVRNPIIVKNIKNFEIISEKVLQKLVLEDINSFLKELGDGFCYIQNEYRIKIGNRYNYIDLLLYNIRYKCYVVVELKVTELKKEHIGQIQVYMNYVNNNIRSIEENLTIGIILVKKDNEFIMEYCSDSRVLSREYSLIM